MKLRISRISFARILVLSLSLMSFNSRVVFANGGGGAHAHAAPHSPAHHAAPHPLAHAGSKKDLGGSGRAHAGWNGNGSSASRVAEAKASLGNGGVPGAHVPLQQMRMNDRSVSPDTRGTSIYTGSRNADGTVSVSSTIQR